MLDGLKPSVVFEASRVHRWKLKKVLNMIRYQTFLFVIYSLNPHISVPCLTETHTKNLSEFTQFTYNNIDNLKSKKSIIIIGVNLVI